MAYSIYGFLKEGTNVDLQPAKREGRIEADDNRKKTYKSRVSQVFADEQIEILMPMEGTKLVLLPQGGVYDLYFSQNGIMYMCKVEIAARYKADNVYMLKVKPLEALKKFQRRQFYRLNYNESIRIRYLTAEEQELINKNEPAEFDEEAKMQSALMLDISGSGMKIKSDEQFEVGREVYVRFDLVKSYTVRAEILGDILSDDGSKMHIVRMVFKKIDKKAQDEIVRFIFEYERKNRQKQIDY